MIKWGQCQRVKHEIKTRTHQPVFTPPRRTVIATQHTIQQNVEKMLLRKLIRPRVRPYSSLVVVVPEKADEKRVCIGNRKRKSITEKNKYPLPS